MKMKNMLVSAILALLANALGLLAAMLFLDGFHIDVLSFVVAVLLFTVIQVVLAPIINSISKRNAPALQGAVAIVTIFLGLWITSLILSGMQIGGLTNWLLATIIVWIVAFLGGIILPRMMFKEQTTGS
jgi:Mycobacterial 4 TMS phage holin, superfamily IV